MATGRQIVEAAIAARSHDDAVAVNKLIASFFGDRYERPVDDVWHNGGLFSQPGEGDLKVIECVTNMQDAVIERYALGQYGGNGGVPFSTPHQAAESLVGNLPYQELAKAATVEFHQSDPAEIRNRLTVTFRDEGCGMTPSDVTDAFMVFGSSRKNECKHLQGAFGMGGKSAFKFAKSVVLVSRRAPELLLAGEADVITVVVVEWMTSGKGTTAYYLVSEPWGRRGDQAAPLSIPASELPSFQPGTYLALVSFQVQGFQRQRLGDDRSFDTVLNTRLFRPVIPVRLANPTRNRFEYLRGLEKRLADNPRADRPQGKDVLPFRLEGKTYHLPMSYWVFSRPREAGGRDKFVARNHAVAFTSNGQIHKHWTPLDFRSRTRLTKLTDRILVVVETDELPIEVRTSIFTPDRSNTVDSDVSLALEQAVAGFISDWPELQEINRDLIREALASGGPARSTKSIADKISRAMKVRGFGAAGAGGHGGGTRPPQVPGNRRVPIDLYPDPTHLEGPASLRLVQGKTRWATFILNAENGFDQRCNISVTCSHPEIRDREITIGELRNGYFRVSIAVPDTAQLGVYELNVVVDNWLRARGGAGAPLSWTTSVDVVDEATSTTTGGAGTGTGNTGVGTGSSVALVWQTPEAMAEWTNSTVGEVMPVAASDLAEKYSEYAELKNLGDTEIPTLFLNSTFRPLKDYYEARLKVTSEEAAGQSKDRFAAGAGVGLLLLDEYRQKLEKQGKELDPKMQAEVAACMARSVLSVLPDFDQISQEAGLDQE